MLGGFLCFMSSFLRFLVRGGGCCSRSRSRGTSRFTVLIKIYFVDNIGYVEVDLLATSTSTSTT